MWEGHDANNILDTGGPAAHRLPIWSREAMVLEACATAARGQPGPGRRRPLLRDWLASDECAAAAPVAEAEPASPCLEASRRICDSAQRNAAASREPGARGWRCADRRPAVCCYFWSTNNREEPPHHRYSLLLLRSPEAALSAVQVPDRQEGIIGTTSCVERLRR